MITFIPLQNYYDIFKFITLAFIGVLCILVASRKELLVSTYDDKSNITSFLGHTYFITTFLLIGLRPISYAFGDMGNYYKHFLEYQRGYEIKDGDFLFESLMHFSANYLTAEIFFFICSTLYLLPLLMASKRIFKQYWSLAFFFIIAHYSFYGYAVNGIRNGIATSLFILAVTYRGPTSWLLIASSIGFHSSLLLPSAAFMLTKFYTNPKKYTYSWLACLGISTVYSGFGELISSYGLAGDAFDSYLRLEGLEDQFSSVGFRLDFVLYSALPILVGYYFLIIKGITDPFYERLLCIYLACNSFWLLVIRIPFSNRFSYLSWFMMGLVIAYPFIKHSISPNQHKSFASMLFCFYLFTFSWG